MAAHRFYVGEGGLAGLAEGAEIALSGEIAHRMGHVLRMRSGENVRLFADGREFETELVRVGETVRGRLLGELAPEPARVRLTLYQALIRPNRFEWLIEKGTEVGVTRFVPLLTEHTSRPDGMIGATRFERWARIAVEASEQCGRRLPPFISKPLEYRKSLAQASGVRVFTWEGLRSGTGGDELKRADGIVDYSLFVGPEGGWSADEVEAARAVGVVFLGLGPTLLRAETAAIAAAALLLLAEHSYRA